MHSIVPRPKDPCAKRCPALIRETLDLIAGKWVASIVVTLHESSGPLRYAELQRSVGKITPKELTKHLRRLESAGLINRRVYPTIPPSVEYSLTELGVSLYPSLESLADWAATFGSAVDRNKISRKQSTDTC